MKCYKSLAIGHLLSDARRRSLACTLILGLMLVAGTRLLAQGITGTISGTVTVTQVSTNTVHTLTTSENGSFTATQLPPGDYNVEVEHQGFQHFRQIGVH